LKEPLLTIEKGVTGETVMRKMDPTDLDEVLAIELQSSWVPWTRQMFLGEILNSYGHGFVMESSATSMHRVVGFVCFRHLGEESELLNLSVHPEHRSLGLGKKLLQFYIASCREAKVTRSYLEVSSTNQPAIQLYQDFAYRLVGRRLKFYRGQLDALLMVKELDP
jgi:ribosomal-protein-alanine N-acetyltransferase